MRYTDLDQMNETEYQAALDIKGLNFMELDRYAAERSADNGDNV